MLKKIATVKWQQISVVNRKKINETSINTIIFEIINVNQRIKVECQIFFSFAQSVIYLFIYLCFPIYNSINKQHKKVYGFLLIKTVDI